MLTGDEAFSRLANDWRALVPQAPTATPFQTFEWHETYRKHYVPRRKVQIVEVREGQDLVGLMPIVHSRGIWRTVRPLGIGPSDYLHPLARSGYEADVATLVHREIHEMRDVDLIDWHQVRETRDFVSNRTDVIKQATCLVVDLPETFDKFIEGMGKNLRVDLRKMSKPPFSNGIAKIEDVGSSGWEVLLDQHRRRWRKRGLPGAFVGPALRFHREWVQLCEKNGWLRLSVLKVEGTAVASIYAMSLGDTSYYYQAGVDTESTAIQSNSMSPGLMLMGATVKRAIEEGRTHFDLMRGDEPYKRRWKPNHVLSNFRMIESRTGLGVIGAGFNNFGSSVELKVRARLEGRGLL